MLILERIPELLSSFSLVVLLLLLALCLRLDEVDAETQFQSSRKELWISIVAWKGPIAIPNTSLLFKCGHFWLTKIEMML